MQSGFLEMPEPKAYGTLGGTGKNCDDIEEKKLNICTSQQRDQDVRAKASENTQGTIFTLKKMTTLMACGRSLINLVR